jgi:hypothetical protein
VRNHCKEPLAAKKLTLKTIVPSRFHEEAPTRVVSTNRRATICQIVIYNKTDQTQSRRLRFWGSMRSVLFLVFEFRSTGFAEPFSDIDFNRRQAKH